MREKISQEEHAAQRVKAAIAVSNLDNDVALDIILRLEEATEEQLQACLDLFDQDR